MPKNNIERDVKTKCIEEEMTQAKLAEEIKITPSYGNQLIRKSDNVVNRGFISRMGALGYDVELHYVKREG